MVVVSTAACGPNNSGAVSLVPRFVRVAASGIRRAELIRLGSGPLALASGPSVARLATARAAVWSPIEHRRDGEARRLIATDRQPNDAREERHVPGSSRARHTRDLPGSRPVIRPRSRLAAGHSVPLCQPTSVGKIGAPLPDRAGGSRDQSRQRANSWSSPGWARRRTGTEVSKPTRAVEIVVGRRRFAPEHRALDETDAAAVVVDYKRRNRWILPVVHRVLTKLLGWRYNGSKTAQHRLVRQLPIVAFRPRGRPVRWLFRGSRRTRKAQSGDAVATFSLVAAEPISDQTMLQQLCASHCGSTTTSQFPVGRAARPAIAGSSRGGPIRRRFQARQPPAARGRALRAALRGPVSVRPLSRLNHRPPVAERPGAPRAAGRVVLFPAVVLWRRHRPGRWRRDQCRVQTPDRGLRPGWGRSRLGLRLAPGSRKLASTRESCGNVELFGVVEIRSV